MPVSNFLYSRAELLASPSVRDGVSLAEERAARVREMEYIAAAGSELFNRRQHVIYTAMCHWHRFYARRSLRQYPPALTSVACLLLASKVCEPPVLPLHLFVRAFLQRAEGLPDVDPRTAKAVEARERIVVAERALLEALEYDVDVELPGPSLLAAAGDAVGAPELLRRRAATAVSNILRSELPLRFPAWVLAEGAVAVAYRVGQLPLPTAAAAPGDAAAAAAGGAGGGASSSGSGGGLRASPADLDEVIATVQAYAELAVAAAAAAARLGGAQGGGGGGVQAPEAAAAAVRPTPASSPPLLPPPPRPPLSAAAAPLLLR